MVHLTLDFRPFQWHANLLGPVKHHEGSLPLCLESFIDFSLFFWQVGTMWEYNLIAYDAYDHSWNVQNTRGFASFSCSALLLAHIFRPIGQVVVGNLPQGHGTGTGVL